MVLYTFLYYLTLFFAPLIGYLLLLKRQSPTDWYYPIRYYFAKNKINRNKSKPFEAAAAAEKVSEYHLIKAIDQNNNYLIFKLTLKKQRLAESTILLKLNNKTYRLPNAPEVTLSSVATSGEFKAAGLEIQFLETHRRLRILYNGLLIDDAGNLEHFRLNFIWTCGGKPFFHPEDASTALLADALARERWRDGNWLQLLPQENYYEQYGALKGRITTETESVDVNFASYHKCSQTTVDHQQVNKELTFFAAAADGTVFNLGVKSFSNGGCAQLKYGTLITNNGNVFGLDSHDLNLLEGDSFPNVFVIHFDAGGETCKCVIHLNISKSTKERCSEENGWEIVRIPFECVLNAQSADGIFTAFMQSRGTGKQNPPPVLADFNKQTCLVHFVKPLQDDYSKNLRFSGGKANSLALLTLLHSKHEFKIPPGVVVFVAAFRFQILKNNEIAEALKKLEGTSDEELEGACKRTIEIISKTEIHDSIRKNLTEELKNIYVDGSQWSWAVRSSAIGEDSSDLSAAGQNATYLGCKTESDILEALAKCWASPYSYKSVQYRKQHGLPIRCDLAVVIQKMVSADSAGVLFTCEPATGNPIYMVITSNYGLGESVVSGTAEPDTILLKRDHKTQELSVHSQTVGSKNVRIVMNSKSNGIESENVSEKEADLLSLTEKQILQLGSVAWNIEKSFGHPVDIEWAFEKNDLFILQARPVTTLNSWCEFELLHEFDSAILSEEDTFLTKANVGEVMPGALTVLSRATTASLVGLAVEKSARVHLNRFRNRSFSYQQHHVFIEFTNTFSQTYGQDTDAVTNQALDLSVFGHLVRTPEIASVVVRRYGETSAASKWKKMKYLLETLKVVWSADDFLKKAININKSVYVNIQKEDNSEIAHNKIQHYLEETFLELALCHAAVSQASVFYQFVAMTILTKDQPTLTADHYHDISLLFSCDEDVVSAEIPKKLQQLAKAITEAGLSDEFLAVPPENGMQFLEKHSPNIYTAFCAFLAEQGHRSLREFELQADTWGAEPKKLIELIKQHIKTANFCKTTKNLSVDATAEKLLTPKDNTTRKLLKFVMAKSRKAVARREATKCELIRGVDKTRKAYQTLAEILKSEGKIPSVDLIYHLSDHEIGDLIQNQGNAPVLVKKSLLRRRLYAKWDALRFLEISRGIPVPLQENKTVNTTQSLKEIKGTPVCMGEVEGRACVINNIEDANQIQQGDILITYCTDTAWSLYFPMLSGIVTELGGLISHGAVVAREFCLPCIVGTGNATKIFKTGDIVHLSGTKGVLRLIK